MDSEKRNIKHVDDNRLLHLENAKKEMEKESNQRLSMLQSQLIESKKKLQEMEFQSSRLNETLREKDDKWQKNLTKLMKDFKVCSENYIHTPCDRL